MQQYNKILLIEDDPDDCFIFQSVIEDYFPKAVLSVAKDGQAALELLEEDVPDIIFTDVNMPRLDGRGFLDAFNELHSAHNHIPVIALSTSDAPHDKLDMQERGAVFYLVKRGTYTAMCEAIGRVLATDWLTCPK